MISLRRTSRISVDRLLPQAERAQLLAQAARRERDGLITAGRASRSYRTLVDGREGVAEERIRPGGVIVYRFNTLGQAVTYAVAFAIAHSPSKSGAFRRGWFVSVNGRPWVGDLNDIPPFAEVLVANAAPYARKIDTGGQVTIGMRVAELTRQAVRRQYPNLDATRELVQLSGQVGGFATPYILRGKSRSMARRYAAHVAAENAGRKARKIRTVRTRRKDSAEGQQVTYPAILISTRRGYG